MLKGYFLPLKIESLTYCLSIFLQYFPFCNLNVLSCPFLYIFQKIRRKRKKKKRKYNRKRYKNFSKEEKKKKHQYERECYKNLFKDQKQRIVKYK